jgi:uncharacterized protein YgbK (DUF1537 family)
MTVKRPLAPAPPITGPVALDDLTSKLPSPYGIDPGRLKARVANARRLVVLDDDPTGTQSVADLPVLTSWTVDDLRWALRQPTSGFFILTNTRSLSEADAVERNQQIVRALAQAADIEDVDYSLVSRGDSTLRGYYPLETDVLAKELAAQGVEVDGVVIVPAYIEPGRVTIDSVHWMHTARGMIPVAHSEFAKDASFGYYQSDLREWVQEKTAGRIAAADVAAITVADLRAGGPERVRSILTSLRGGRPVVVDAVADDDLRVLVTALVQAEAEGKTFICRTGPSFVRARCGQQATPVIGGGRLRHIVADSHRERVTDLRPASRSGLIVVGSHVGLTTRQLDRLRDEGNIAELELDVPTLMDPVNRAAHITDTAQQAIALLRESSTTGDVVIRTSRTVMAGADASHSLAIARAVSAALVAAVQQIVAAVRPSFVVAKGGITSSDTATEGLGIRRAWARGTLLPGIVALWEPVSGPAQGIPYVVFAGNVGDDDALVAVCDTLRWLRRSNHAQRV